MLVCGEGGGGWMLGCLNFSDSNYNRGILVEINGI